MTAAGPGIDGAVRRASHPVPFAQLVRVEASRLVGTRAARIVLVGGILFDCFALVVAFPPGLDASDLASAAGQIRPGLIALHLSQIGVHAVVVMLIAGEWQHRSAQWTLLVQPARRRYLLAQSSVVALFGLGCWLLHTGTVLVAASVMAENAHVVGILAARPAWTVLVIGLASLGPVVVALLVAMLTGNIAATLGVYFGAVPLMLIPELLVPGVAAWVAPFSAANAVADQVDGPGLMPSLTSVFVWVVLAAFLVRKVVRRDAA